MRKIRRLLRYDLPLHFVLFLTNWLPDNTPFLRFRGSLASFFLGECGQGLELGRNITFYNPSKISIGNNVYIAFGCWFMAGESITIGDEVIFGPYCVVVSSNHKRHKGSFRFGGTSYQPIHIQSGCWISSHSVITAGTSIGKGSLVAAGAIVRGIIPSDVLAGGIPAKVTKEIKDNNES